MRTALLLVATLGLLAPAAARAQHTEISPYIEASQVLTADLQNGDVLTYSTLAAGVDASVRTRRVEVQLSYQYEHSFAWDDGGDSDVHSGLARANVLVTRDVTFEAGAIATRARSDVRGISSFFFGDDSNTSTVYSGYLGPNVATHVGPASVTALYRLGYTKAETPGFTGVPADQPRLDYYDDAVSQLAMASIGTQAGEIAPFGITLSGAAQREDAGQLDQRYQGGFLRGDIVQPVSRELALVAGAGYEHIRISQRDPLLDADGDPLLDSNGRFVTDPASPRRTAYETDNPLFWDAGIIWRPSPRTELEARVGRRYDSWSYTGSFSHQIGPGSGIQIGVYDSVQSFGRQLNDGLASLPTSFTSTQDPFSDNYNGCVFGTVGNAAGGCLNGIFQSVATANYRARGINGVIAFNRGPTRYGFGAGYANRRFYAPDVGEGFTVNGVSDDAYYAQAFAARALDSASSIEGNVYVSRFHSGIVAAPAVWEGGANGSYHRSFGKLAASASVGIYWFDQQSADDVFAQALLALGYRF